jgi:hypothetical protein
MSRTELESGACRRFSPALSVPELNSSLGSSMCADRGMAEHVLMDAILLGLCRGVIDCGNGGVYGNDVEPIASQLRNHRQPRCVLKLRGGRVHISCLLCGCVVNSRQ